jgi:hypothetical protein
MKTANGIVRTPTGLILYDGPSVLDGKPIVVIANAFLGGENAKTGKVIQTWILVKDIPPIKAHQCGEDYRVCGDCKHRHFGSCYVNLLYGPNPVYRAYQSGSYRKMTIDDMIFFKDRMVRIGSYGDPAAVPMYVWHSICSVAKRFVGYTHQWHKCDPALKRYCMASVDSIIGYYPEKSKAQNMGWRTFRVREQNDPLMFDDEMICPASKEGGKTVTCTNCGNCCGNESNRKNPVIIIHGWSNKNKTYFKGMMKIKHKKGWKKVYPTFPREAKIISVNSVDKGIEQVKMLIQGL